MDLQGKRALVTGGHRGLGRGLVDALLGAGARVTVLGRPREPIAGVETVVGDITDRSLAASLMRELRPDVVALNAGATPKLATIDQQRWEDFSVCWEQDVKAGLVWIQEALRLPLAAGSRMLLGSSGAAASGSPLTGGYAGAKRMLWIMAKYANGVSEQRQLGIRFQVLVPMQMVGETERGREASQAYAKRLGKTPEAFLAGFGKPLPPALFGAHVLSILRSDEAGTAFGIKGDFGVRLLDEA